MSRSWSWAALQNHRWSNVQVFLHDFSVWQVVLRSFGPVTCVIDGIVHFRDGRGQVEVHMNADLIKPISSNGSCHDEIFRRLVDKTTKPAIRGQL